MSRLFREMLIIMKVLIHLPFKRNQRQLWIKNTQQKRNLFANNLKLSQFFTSQRTNYLPLSYHLLQILEIQILAQEESPPRKLKNLVGVQSRKIKYYLEVRTALRARRFILKRESKSNMKTCSICLRQSWNENLCSRNQNLHLLIKQLDLLWRIK